jgi:lycopene cyclase domain-containing protein
MRPSQLEYLALAAIYVLIIYTLLQKQISTVTRRSSFWVSGLIFCLLWALLEGYALKHGWWVFNPDKISGLYLLGIPVEEYLAFALIHLSTVALLEGFRRDELD